MPKSRYAYWHRGEGEKKEGRRASKEKKHRLYNFQLRLIYRISFVAIAISLVCALSLSPPSHFLRSILLFSHH